MSSFLFAKQLLFLYSFLSVDSFSSPSSPNLKQKKKISPYFIRCHAAQGDEHPQPSAQLSLPPLYYVAARLFTCVTLVKRHEGRGSKASEHPPPVSTVSYLTVSPKSSNHRSQAVAPRFQHELHIHRCLVA